MKCEFDTVILSNSTPQVKYMLRLVVVGALLLAVFGGDSRAQEQPTPAPVQLNAPTSLPLPGNAAGTATPAPTETPPGLPILEALEGVGDVNVREEADPEAAVLGTISHGTQYVVTGRYYRWYQFRFDRSSTGLGYVFEELVQVTGDSAQITDLTLLPTVAVDAEVVGATQTWEAITQTPGIALTATANAGILSGPIPAGEAGLTLGTIGPDATPGGQAAGPLPTFTFPPDLVRASDGNLFAQASPTPDLTRAEAETASQVTYTPAMPILLLGALGVLGLLVSAARR